MMTMDMTIDVDVVTIEEADIEATKEEEDIAKVVVKSVEALAKGQSLNLIRINIVHVMKDKIMILAIVGPLLVKEKLQMEIRETQMVQTVRQSRIDHINQTLFVVILYLQK